MQFIKKLFGYDDSIIGLCGIKKQHQYAFINIPNHYKRTTLSNVKKNTILI